MRKSATDTNTPAMTWAARVCRKIGVPSLGRSAAKSLTSVVVDILSSGFTYVACVPVTPTPFIRQPAVGTTRTKYRRLFFVNEERCVRTSHLSRRPTRRNHRDHVISRARGRVEKEARGAGEDRRDRRRGRKRRTKGKERKKARATRARRTLARKSIHVRA